MKYCNQTQGVMGNNCAAKLGNQLGDYCASEWHCTKNHGALMTEKVTLAEEYLRGLLFFNTVLCSSKRFE